ncbi:MAG: hypothetical protein ACXACY_20350 [Candidatus Hodarchaeales archaeon]
MKKLKVLIIAGCSKEKLDIPAPAIELNQILRAIPSISYKGQNSLDNLVLLIFPSVRFTSSLT